MPLLRTLAHLMLVLALLAGGLAPGGVAAQSCADAGAAGAAEAGMAGGCHDLASDPLDLPGVVPDDCCEGGCTCDCVNPMQSGLLAAPSPSTLPARGAVRRPFTAVRLSATAAPDIRPPIA